MKSAIVVVFGLVMMLSGCGERPNQAQKARILAMGDSLLATHSGDRASVSFQLEALMGEPVIDRAISGAKVINVLPVSSALGLQISNQYLEGEWEWVVLNGGGNDLWLGCGCFACDARMTRMISAAGDQGRIVDLVSQLRSRGAQVIYVGYLRSPGLGSPIEHCRKDGDELERRIARMAAADGGVHFLSLSEMVPFGDRSFHAADRIHPSKKASARIAQEIARVITTHDGA